jgi:hypothetical protein
MTRGAQITASSRLRAASATFAPTAGVCVRRARLRMVFPDSRANLARRQAETPLSALCRFPGPALRNGLGLNNTTKSPIIPNG